MFRAMYMAEPHEFVPTTCLMPMCLENRSSNSVVRLSSASLG